MDMSLVSKLYSIFNDKQWMKREGHEVVFDNYCKLLGNLTSEQCELIIDLTERYTWISFNEYMGRLVATLDKVEESKLESLKKIVLFPVMRPKDEVKTKSGHTILYMFRAAMPNLAKYNSIEFVEVEAFGELSEEKYSPENNECIFLLDDYLGSGETIKATIEELLKNTKVKADMLNVVALAAQKETVDYLKSNKIPIYTSFISKKGISDYYKSPELEEKVKTMESIEKLIPNNKYFYFGYRQSEALITMMRTPDNTFPIFWKDYKKNGDEFKAPFARY